MKALRTVLFLLAAPLATAAARATTPPDISGLWVNPYNSVVVRTGPCGQGLCGWVVWVNDVALADAKSGGVADPVGFQVLRDYRPDGEGGWRGTVFVLDMGRSFSSRIVALSPRALKISGCLVGGFLCKSQIWHRG